MGTGQADPPHDRPVICLLGLKTTFKRIVLILALGPLAWPLPTEAQDAGKVYRIGNLHSVSTLVPHSNDAFWEGMRELGYVEGKHYVLENRTRETKTDRLSDLAAELVGLKVDIILTAGSPAAHAAKEVTNTIPIVMMDGADPVRRGLVASLAHPGGNITGVYFLGGGLDVKRLELLAETVPGAKRVAVLTASRKIEAREGRRPNVAQVWLKGSGLAMLTILYSGFANRDWSFLRVAESPAQNVHAPRCCCKA